MSPQWKELLSRALIPYTLFKARNPTRTEFYYGGHYISCLEIEQFMKEKELRHLEDLFFEDVKGILQFMITASSGIISKKCEKALEDLTTITNARDSN